MITKRFLTRKKTTKISFYCELRCMINAMFFISSLSVIRDVVQSRSDRNARDP